MSTPVPDHQMFGDAYTPSQIAERVLKMGVTKANADAELIDMTNNGLTLFAMRNKADGRHTIVVGDAVPPNDAYVFLGA